MYALDSSLQAAWQALFHKASGLFPSLTLPRNIVFTDSAEQTLDPSTRIAHTCGYPLMTLFKDRLRPLCVPCFKVSACENGQYHSVFLVRNSDPAHQLSDCQGYRAGINNPMSNSGMNVFRAAVAQLKTAHHNQPFFESLEITGSHLDSMEAIASGKIDIAAIDAITFNFANKFKPDLCKILRTIGNSVSTMGLPFVSRCNSQDISGESLSEALNHALTACPQETGALDINYFKAVTLDDYQSILRLEDLAISRGYPSLA